MKIFLFLLLSIGLFSCSKTQANDTAIPCDPAISYSGTVKNIFITNCTKSGCHDGTNSSYLGDYNVARDASGQIKNSVSRGIMPPANNLSIVDKAAIICWIDSGTKNN
jgi:hypothetical protein